MWGFPSWSHRKVKRRVDETRWSSSATTRATFRRSYWTSRHESIRTRRVHSEEGIDRWSIEEVASKVSSGGGQLGNSFAWCFLWVSEEVKSYHVVVHRKVLFRVRNR